MAVITRSAHPEALWPGVQAWFGTKYKDLPQGWTQIFDKRASEKAFEKLVESTQSGYAPVKPEGNPIRYDEMRQGYTSTITAVAYALGYIVTKEERDDGQYKELGRMRSGSLAKSLKATREFVHANRLNRAFNASYTIGDGATLCSTSHPTRAGNQANRPAVDADLEESSLEDMIILIQNATNARGMKADLTADRLIIALRNQFNAARILKSVGRVGTANNDINAIKEMGMLPKGVFCWRYLTDDDGWGIQTDAEHGFVHFERDEIVLEQDNDFDTKNARASAYMRFGEGVGDFRCYYATQGA